MLAAQSEPISIGMLPFKMSICGLDEIERFAGAGVSHVVSLLDPDWPDPDGWAALGPVEHHRFHMHDIISDMPGWRPPLEEDVERLLEVGDLLARSDVDHLLVHCHFGRSRSTAAALILKTQHHPGRETEAAEALLAVRNPLWPNSRMVAYADRLLERDGRLIAAARGLYARVAREHPHFADFIRRTERASEVPEG